MPFPRSRKLRQSPSAHPAINTTHSVHAEPERSTSLTYFYIHAQVVHRSLSRRASPPASLGHFLRSSGLTQVAMKCLLPARGALTARQSGCGTRLSLVSAVVVPWEKSKPPCTLPPGFQIQRWSSISAGCHPFVYLIPKMESFKVIAFDKLCVNSNLSSGNSVP